MLVVRDAQLRAFEHAAVERYVDELVAHCRAFSPRLCATLRDTQLRAAVRHGVARAEEHGFTLRGPVRFYVEMMIVLGSGFDDDPQYPWVGEILARRDLGGQMELAEALHEAASAYLARVDGPDNVHTLAALAELAARQRQGLTVHHETLEQDLLRTMAETHPRKADATGDVALRRLVTEGLARGRQLHGFREARSLALMVVLMFAFGHRCDADPFLPWIARTLGRADEAGPDAAAVALERRALIWLDAVLRNAAEDR